MNHVKNKSGVKKALQFIGFVLICAAVGYAFGSYLGRTLGEAGPDIEIDLSVLVAAVIAIIYVMMAAIVLFGAALPEFGAKLLKMEDVEEIRDERTKLIVSGASLAACGLALLVMAFADKLGLPMAVVAVLFFALMFGAFALYIPLKREMDELDRVMGDESTTLTYYAVLVVGGSWAALAHLDLVQGPAMLDWLSMFWAFMLIMAFVVTGRRGMLADD